MSATSAPGRSEESGAAASDPTRALDVQSIGRMGAAVAWLTALGGGGGAFLLIGSGDVAALTGGILLAIAALAGLAVGVQATGEPWPGEPGYGERPPEGDGSPPEGGEGAVVAASRRYLPLADRLALGLLGGALGGTAVTGAVWLTDGVGAADLLGVQIAGTVTATSLGLRAWYGALWGVALGILYPRLPGRSPVARCTLFGLAPALYALLVLYPLVLDLGWFAAELGALTFVFVVFFHLLWGALCGGLFRWAEVTDLGLLSRPLVGGREPPR